MSVPVTGSGGGFSFAGDDGDKRTGVVLVAMLVLSDPVGAGELAGDSTPPWGAPAAADWFANTSANLIARDAHVVHAEFLRVHALRKEIFDAVGKR